MGSVLVVAFVRVDACIGKTLVILPQAVLVPLSDLLAV